MTTLFCTGLPASAHALGTTGTAQASRSRLDFHARGVGEASRAQKLTLTNVGAAALALGKPSVSGGHGFRLSADSCAGRTLAPGTRCTVTVIFDPRSIAQGRSAAP